MKMVLKLLWVLKLFWCENKIDFWLAFILTNVFGEIEADRRQKEYIKIEIQPIK